MNFLRNLGAVCAVLCSVATNASAVTVSVTHRATVDYIDLNTGDFDLIYNPEPGRTVNVGDIATVSYTIDLDQTPSAGEEKTTFLVPSTSEFAGYLSGPATLSFSSGLTFDLGPVDIFTQASTLADGATFYRHFGGYIFGDASSGDASVHYTSSRSADDISAPFQPDLASLIARGVVDNGFYLDLALSRDILGSAIECVGGAVCQIYAVETQTSISKVGAVPLPAPFAMLGLAMVGLFGFGRRSLA